MNPVRVAGLMSEVNDVLPAGRVGLYEFIWILRSDERAGTLAEWKTIARQALDQLLAQGDCHLARMHWPGHAEYPMPPGYQVRDEDFDDIPDDGWYLALVPNT